MPNWLIPERRYDLPRNIALLDTNVLISLSDASDGRHRNTIDVLDFGEFRWAVAYATVVEAWNFLVGRHKKRYEAYRLMEWVLTPGEVILLNEAIETHELQVAHVWCKQLKLDIVDAMLVSIADKISRECNIAPSVHVATYDTGDFLRLFGAERAFNVYDMRDASSTSDTQ